MKLNIKNLNTYQVVGLLLLTVGVIGAMSAYGALVIYSPGPVTISLAYPGVINPNQEIGIIAGLGLRTGLPPETLWGQTLTLYVDNSYVDSGITSSNTMCSAILHWTSTTVGTHYYNVTFAGNTEFPSGAWVYGEIGVSETPPDNNPTEWEYLISQIEAQLSSYYTVLLLLGGGIFVYGSFANRKRN